MGRWACGHGRKDNIKTHAVNKADVPKGSMEGGQARVDAYIPTSIAAFQATNDLLTRGVALYRALQAFEDSGRDFGAGTIIVPSISALANQLANQRGLDVFAIEEMPEGAIPMRKQKIAAMATRRSIIALIHWVLTTMSFLERISTLMRSMDTTFFLNYDLRCVST